MNYILFDGIERNKLLPLTYTRPVADIRIGILTIKEKWEKLLNTSVSFNTQEYLNKKYPIVISNENVLINGSILPTIELVNQINGLSINQILIKGDIEIAFRTNGDSINITDSSNYHIVETQLEFLRIENTWDIFKHNPQAIIDDFSILTADRVTSKISHTNSILGDPANIFIEEGAIVEFAYLNTSDGPIYIGKDSEVMEGSKIRGPFALCEHATIKMDAKIYSGTTIGPHSKVGGEVSNSVILGYSNKGHDGFLGNSVIGEWCNLGADTNTSNLKNTYDFVRLWSYAANTFVSTGLQFCGLIMGDHSKSGINTMFNTGTVVGVSSNIYGSGFQRNFVSSFLWGGTHGLKTYNFKKSVEVAKAVYKRRGMEFNETEKEIFSTIFKLTHES
ncbi:MAG: GlmU family protein, partial [Bacteroidetes bacterium]|nr:GlmU family protein [Bacteroidota bacterium]